MKKFSRVVACAAAAFTLSLADPATVIANGIWWH